MTNNQLSYLNLVRQKDYDNKFLKETGRHNLVTEKLTRRMNKESARHNLVTEGNQVYSTDMSAKSAKYASDASAAASKYAADKNAAAAKYSADTAANTSKYVADRNAQTELTKAQINKLIQEAKNKVNKAMNDDNIEAAQKRQIAKNASDQFIAKLNRELEKAKLDKQSKLKASELAIQLQDSIAKNLDTKSLFKQLWSLLGK